MNAGLCAACSHARRIRSDRGSEFLFCGLSGTDARFPKYPRLPVFVCAGYEGQTAPPQPESPARDRKLE